MSGRPRWRDLDGVDPYALLGVGRDATEAEINTAHRRRLQAAHPDRPGGDTTLATLLNVARDVLADPVARSALDRATRTTTGGTDDTVAGAGEAAAETSSPWSGDDVAAGFSPPTTAPQAGSRNPPPQRPESAPPWHWPPNPPRPAEVVYPATIYYRPQPDGTVRPIWTFPAPAPPRMSMAVPVAALVTSVACWPIGLVLTIIALTTTRTGEPGRTVAVVAAVVNSVFLTAILCSIALLLASSISTGAT